MPSARGIPSCPGVPRRKERRRERLTAAPQNLRALPTDTDTNKEALHPKIKGFFPSVTPTGFEPVLPP